MFSEECRHERTEVRERRYANGTTHLAQQCLHCGKQTCTIPKNRRMDYPLRLPAWDDSLAQAFWEKQRQFWAERHAAERAAKSAEWWSRWRTHMASPEWASLRKRALERDAYICQGCRLRSAVQVHHLTYERLGCEMLFDLVSVCMECHNAIHGDAES